MTAAAGREPTSPPAASSRPPGVSLFRAGTGAASLDGTMFRFGERIEGMQLDTRLSPTPPLRRLLGLALTLAVLAAACGGSEDDPAGIDPPADESTPDSDTSEDGETPAATGAPDDSDSDSDSAAPASSDGTASSIAWTAPDGGDPVAVAVSPDGSRVALGFAGELAADSQPGDIVVFDTTTSSELWRVTVDDVGFSGLNLVYTSAGVTAVVATFDGSTVATYNNGSLVSEAPVADIDCGQFLNGVADPAAPAFFTVIPGGACRVDVTSGASTKLTVADIATGVGRVPSVRWDGDVLLVAYEADTDAGFVSDTASVDPAAFTVLEAATGRAEPPSAADRFGDRLEDGIFSSSEARSAQSPDGTTVALIQPGRIDIVR